MKGFRVFLIKIIDKKKGSKPILTTFHVSIGLQNNTLRMVQSEFPHKMFYGE